MNLRLALSALLLAAAAPLAAAPSIGLQSGVTQSFTIPAGAFTNSFYVDVGANDRQLRIELNAQAGVDTDVLLRYGTPFAESGASGPPDIEYLFETAQYRSTSFGAAESIAIGKSNPQPVREGRWFISVINFAGTPANATLRATLLQQDVQDAALQVVFDDPSDGCGTAGWNDGSSRSPVGGNAGTTLGQQRRNAMLEAARLLGQAYRSPVPLRVQACWSDQLGTGSGSGGFTLAGSGPRFIVRNEARFLNDGTVATGDRAPWLPRNYTWYANTTIGKLAGTRACTLYPTSSNPCAEPDFDIQFNVRVDSEGSGFYYGLTPAGSGNNRPDFVTVAMHELTHGLGFSAQVNLSDSSEPIGARAAGFDDVFSANVADLRPDGTLVPFMDETDAQREAALLSFTQLRWTDTAAVNSTLNAFRSFPAPENTVRLYSTSTLEPGSTLSHTSFAHAPDLMNPTINNGLRTSGLSRPMLDAMGWSDAAAPVPSTAPRRSTQYFDPRYPGHGIDVERAAGNSYVVIFYTYGANGEPEWYLAAGELVDGVFAPQNNANGDSLVRYRYTAGGNPPQVADPSIRGQIRLDFNQAAIANECRDGVARDQGTPLVLMTWSIGNDRNQRWCMQALIPESLRTTPDFTGSWYAGADSGWGWSLLNYRSGSSNALFGLLYYPDVNGNGRWAFVQSDNPTGGTLTLSERRGYCRTCAPPPNGQFNDVNAGTASFTLTQPSDNPAAGNRSTFNATYQTAPGGSFARQDSPLILLSAPAQ